VLLYTGTAGVDNPDDVVALQQTLREELHAGVEVGCSILQHYLQKVQGQGSSHLLLTFHEHWSPTVCPLTMQVLIYSDAVTALASGTGGVLHGALVQVIVSVVQDLVESTHAALNVLML
jgi:hypothetical protein